MLWRSIQGENNLYSNQLREQQYGTLIILNYYNGVILSATASQITSVSIVNSTVCSGVDQRKHQSSTPLAFGRGIHRWPVNSHKMLNFMTSSGRVAAQLPYRVTRSFPCFVLVIVYVRVNLCMLVQLFIKYNSFYAFQIVTKWIVIIHLIEFLIFPCFVIYLCLISDIGHSNIQSLAKRTLRNPSKFEYQVWIQVNE